MIAIVALTLACDWRLSWTAPSDVDTTPVDAGTILRIISDEAPGSVRFREVRTLQLLKQPLVTSGTLRFTSPDRLERTVVFPVPETSVIQGSTMTVERDGTQSVVHLDGSSVASVMTQSLCAVLRGDLAALSELNEIRTEGTVSAWTLRLRPRGSGLPTSEIRMAGRRGMIDELEVFERGRDRTLITLER